MNAVTQFILWPVTLCYAVASISFMVEGKWHLAGVYACLPWQITSW